MSKVSVNDVIILKHDIGNLLKAGGRFKVTQVTNKKISFVGIENTPTCDKSGYIPIDDFDNVFALEGKSGCDSDCGNCDKNCMNPENDDLIFSVDNLLEAEDDIVVAAVDDSDIEYQLDGCKIWIKTVFDKCTIVALQLTNGYVLVENSSALVKENYDKQYGIRECLKKLIRRVYELEAYLASDYNADVIPEEQLISSDGHVMHFSIHGDDFKATW